ncbi:hypothetical protein FRC07_010111, partial [Ceratobasidium sp. 392]
MSRPAWMTDDLEEEWVEPESSEGGSGTGDISQHSQRSRRSYGGSRAQRSPHVYGSVRVATSSAASGSDFGGSMRERSVRDLLESGEGAKRKARAPMEEGGAPGTAISLSPDGSPITGTFLVREDVAPEPLKVAPAAFGLKKSGVKNFFSPLALERMFEPPSPPADAKPPAEYEPSPSPLTSDTASTNTNQANTAPATTTSTTPTSLALSKSPSPGSSTPSPHTSPVRPMTHGLSHSPSPSTGSSSASMSFEPSPSAGRGPLGTFRLPRNPHAPLRPSRLSESHLVKPYASFEADETTSSRSSLPKDVLGDISEHIMPEAGEGPARTSVSPSITELMGAEDDEERLTNDFDFGDDELVIEDDIDAEDADGELDSILDHTTSDIGGLSRTPQGSLALPQQEPQKSPEARTQPAPKTAPERPKLGTEPDEIVDTDIPGLALFDGRKLSASYQFTFPDPRRDNKAQAGDTPRKKTREDRKREREAERERRNATRALLHPHNALRSITPDVDAESLSSSRSSFVEEQDRSQSPYNENSTNQSNEAQPSRATSRATLSRDDQRTPSPNFLPPRDPRLKLFHFHYDTFTRDHLSALVDSIAVGSVGSSPSIKSGRSGQPDVKLDLNTMEFRAEDPRGLSTPSDAVRYAKKIKLTPPEEYSDWDEDSAEEGQGQAEHLQGATHEPTEDNNQYLRPPPTVRNYAADARNLMLAMRAARSIDGDSAASATQQEEHEPDMSIESS